MENEIKVFSTSGCPWCLRLKQYLDEKNVKYKNIDVSIDPFQAQKMIDKSGEMGVPQMWIGDGVVIGFDREKLDKLLNLK